MECPACGYEHDEPSGEFLSGYCLSCDDQGDSTWVEWDIEDGWVFG